MADRHVLGADAGAAEDIARIACHVERHAQLFHLASDTCDGVMLPESFSRPSCSDSSCAVVILRAISASRICTAWVAAIGRPNSTRVCE